MSASAQCPHTDLHFHFNVAHAGDTNMKQLEIKAHCKICDKPMEFRGMPFGSSPHQPTMAPDGSEARLPFLGEGEEPTGNLIAVIGRRVV